MTFNPSYTNKKSSPATGGLFLIAALLLVACCIAASAQEALPDPFRFADGSRSEKKKDWQLHRQEIIGLLEQYEIGQVPPMDNMTLTSKLEGRSLTVTVAAPNGESIDLTAYITYPGDSIFSFGGKPIEQPKIPENVKPPYPALIGIANCLPKQLFLERGCAIIDFNFNTVCHHQQKRGEEPINKLYPELTANGAYSYWPWGISRIIDALEQLDTERTLIDTKHLAVSGCSWAGKASLWAGAMDERIALVIPQEPGGGGIAAWRVSETLGKVETIGRTDGHWFLESMISNYGNGNIGKLPVDHHELAALIAPRALLYFGNTDYEWLADESGYVSIRAAKEVFRALGVADHVGFAIGGGHGHCQLPKEEYQYLEAYIDRFLLGKKKVMTDFQVAPKFESTNWKKWLW